ncbi:EAL domain-containing response regulator [Cupriavidus metallidurans]|uniref:EAL domain-containing response regulator n=1 Tax=Cupriavidus metallidurans TaxID=119219 RepID=UPI000788480B|nr:EAL domain-containing protein [Cupriavidus metallidurans]
MPAQFEALRVLIVEDHPFQRAVAGHLLHRLGAMNTHAAADGREAEQALREQAFDLVLCDIDMPNCNGPELMARLTRDREHAFFGTPPTWAWTSSLAPDILDSHRAFASEHIFPRVYALAKPLNLITLQAILEEVATSKSVLNIANHNGPTDDELRDLTSHPDALVFMLQPQFHIATGRLAGAEALCRWQHPRLGLIPPTLFIPQLEALDAADVIFLTAIDRCLAALILLAKAGVAVPISVNASAQTLCRPGLVERLESVVAASGVPRARLTLELTEETTVRDPFALGIALNRLRLLGYRIAIDDFGIGIATLKLLADLPFTQMKVDKSFVSQMLAGNQRATICRSIIRLAKDLSMECVAEGVETPAQCAALHALGCDIGQGYLLAPPEPIDVFLNAAPGRYGQE